jgi:hypothetical protein
MFAEGTRLKPSTLEGVSFPIIHPVDRRVKSFQRKRGYLFLTMFLCHVQRDSLPVSQLFAKVISDMSTVCNRVICWLI